MPQGPAHLHEKWQSDSNACKYLENRGYTLTRGYEWKLPSAEHKPSAEELEAMNYLVWEWDFGGLEEVK